MQVPPNGSERSTDSLSVSFSETFEFSGKVYENNLTTPEEIQEFFEALWNQACGTGTKKHPGEVINHILASAAHLLTFFYALQIPADVSPELLVQTSLHISKILRALHRLVTDNAKLQVLVDRYEALLRDEKATQVRLKVDNFTTSYLGLSDSPTNEIRKGDLTEEESEGYIKANAELLAKHSVDVTNRNPQRSLTIEDIKKTASAILVTCITEVRITFLKPVTPEVEL